MKKTHLLLASSLFASSVMAFGDDSCAKLSAAKIPGATITLAQTVAAGTFVGPPAPFSGGETDGGFRHQGRSVAADLGVEWQDARHWQRWICRADRLRAA